MIKYLLLFIVMASFYIPSAAQSVSGSPLKEISMPPPTLQKGWIGAAIGAGASLLGSLIGKKSQNNQIDKQIAAQKEENEKNRAYNLQLAQMQNAWNQEQWERENEYNSPVNQMKRFEEAGLNPDLMYGQGNSGNAMQLSGGLTSGAPSSPTDFSVLGQKKTLGDVVKDSLQTEST